MSQQNDVPVVGPREPCPCGSGRRYKACHGKAGNRQPVVREAFAGLCDEVDWIAMRELVPAATARIALNETYAARYPNAELLLVTVLPGAVGAIRRADGRVLVAAQTLAIGADPSADIASALLAALEAEPGAVIASQPGPAGAARLQDVIDVNTPLDVHMQETFDFWTGADELLEADIASVVEQANASITPTRQVPGVAGAYWCLLNDHEHVRWVWPNDEDELLTALARVQAADHLTLGPGTRYLGSFRAFGRLAPVWKLAPGDTPEDLVGPMTSLAERIAEALVRQEPLSSDERRAKAGLVNRQVTLK